MDEDSKKIVPTDISIVNSDKTMHKMHQLKRYAKSRNSHQIEQKDMHWFHVILVFSVDLVSDNDIHDR